MADTPRFILPMLDESQSSAEIPHNDALLIIDALMHLSIKDRNLATPPGGPAAGDCYQVAAGGTDAWAGKDGSIAIFTSGGWVFAPVRTGMVMYVEDENVLLVWRASATWGTITVT